jgi:thioesterase domain-containing protein
MEGASRHQIKPAPDATQRFTREHFKPASAFAPPSTALEHQLAGLWEAALNIEGIGIDDDFFEVGGESFAAVTVFTEMERLRGEMPPLTILLDYPTIRKLAALLESMAPGMSSASEIAEPAGYGHAGTVPAPLVAIRAGGRRPPLFFVHGNGGHVLFLAQLAPHLSPDQPLYGIAARGVTRGEPRHRDLAAMVEDYLAAIRKVQPKGPYHLAGFCVGCIVACEIARRLRAEGEDVLRVIMVDPDYNRAMTPWLYWHAPDAPATRLLRLMSAAAWYGRTMTLRLLRRSYEWKLESMQDRRLYRSLQIYFYRVIAPYRPEPYVGEVTLLCSAARAARARRFAVGWGRLAPGHRMIEIDAHHGDLFGSHLPVLASAINAVLDSRAIEDAVDAAAARLAPRLAAE